VEHPGDFGGWRPDAPVGFQALFEAAGGAYVEVPDVDAARAWLTRFAVDFSTVSVGRTVPDTLHPALPVADAADAALGVSMARAAVAETGSLVMDARDGRRTQLLVPTHVVFVRRADMVDTLRDLLKSARADLPSAVGLHSGPSKSADIGQIMVRGVHGPGRVVAVVIGGAGGLPEG
jgi:L-lactate dehydrogenase complex protein LldG